MRISSWNFVCVPKARTKFQLEILIRNTISDIAYFREIILESSRNVTEPFHTNETARCMHWLWTIIRVGTIFFQTLSGYWLFLIHIRWPNDIIQYIRKVPAWTLGISMVSNVVLLPVWVPTRGGHSRYRLSRRWTGPERLLNCQNSNAPWKNKTDARFGNIIWYKK